MTLDRMENTPVLYTIVSEVQDRIAADIQSIFLAPFISNNTSVEIIASSMLYLIIASRSDISVSLAKNILCRSSLLHEIVDANCYDNVRIELRRVLGAWL